MTCRIETRNEVWQCLLDIARCARYYHKKSSSMRKERNIFKYIISIVLIAIGTSIVSYILDGWETALSTLIIVFVTWYLIANYEGRFAMLTVMFAEYQRLERDAEKLWRDVDDETFTDSQIQRGLDKLKEDMLFVDQLITMSAFEIDDSLNEQCAKDAYTVLEQKFA